MAGTPKEDHAGSERMERMIEEMRGRDLWGELFKLRDEQRKALAKSVWLVKGRDLPWQQSRQGKMRWYMHPLLKSPCINTLTIFVQELPPGSRSGRVNHPGNQVMFILEGRGYTVIDGQKHHWGKGDVVQIPLKVKGCVVQHFNADPDNPARFVACEPNAFHAAGVDRGPGFEQLESCPEFKG